MVAAEEVDVLVEVECLSVLISLYEMLKGALPHAGACSLVALESQVVTVGEMVGGWVIVASEYR